MEKCSIKITFGLGSSASLHARLPSCPLPSFFYISSTYWSSTQTINCLTAELFEWGNMIFFKINSKTLEVFEQSYRTKWSFILKKMVIFIEECSHFYRTFWLFYWTEFSTSLNVFPHLLYQKYINNKNLYILYLMTYAIMQLMQFLFNICNFQ